ncbi:MAG: cytochrome c [Proteobacteria bacterium]|nr:MAG: cytochrome c [Pseudomonadota bacterium]
MSCKEGELCEEGRKRKVAMLVLGFMALIFVALSLMSFLDSRGQVIPKNVQYAGFEAVQGKRVFQAYNCMGCHTIVGNGAYFGPDLTNTYDITGPAWLEAFMPSAASWPTQAAVQVQLNKPEIAKEAGVDGIEAYLEKYPGAAERIMRRSGHASIMPNLPLSGDEVSSVIAFLKYTSQMDTEGWPPVPRVAGLTFPHATQMPAAAVSTVVSPQSGAVANALEDPVALGEKLVKDTGCTACHSTGSDTVIGPGWGGLYGSVVTLNDGSSADVDDAYLTEALLDPNAQIAAGFATGLMPAYTGILDTDQVAAIVAYIRSLGGE